MLIATRQVVSSLGEEAQIRFRTNLQSNFSLMVMKINCPGARRNINIVMRG